MPEGDYQAIVLYDGVCGLCNRLVRFLLERDRHRRLRYATLQGELGEEVQKAVGIHQQDGKLETMLLLERDGTLHQRGTAALRTLRYLGGLYPLLSRLSVLPGWLLDPAYKLVARSRYRIFGRLDHCPLPPEGSSERFVD